jgi:hypothetical protein
MTNMSKRLIDIIKTEGVILATLPILGTLSAIAFETGYLSFYDVPAELIEVSLPRIIRAIFTISIIVAILWYLGSRLYAGVTSDSKRIRVIHNLLLFAPLSLYLFWQVYSHPYLLTAFIWPLLLSLAYFSNRLFGPNGRFSEKFPNTAQAYIDGQKFAERAEQYQLIFLAPFSLGLILLFSFGIIGYWTARLERTAWILTENPSYLMVRKYGDNYIFKNFDIKSMEIGDSLIVRRLDDGKSITLKKIKIAELKSPTNKEGK